MNNGESIKKYNDLLISFLNDLVNSIDNYENNKVFFEDIANRLRQQINTYNLDIASEGIKTMMNNAFKEYSNILKKHFDGSNIHKIDINTPDEAISNEMNTITANLANAVTNMNKIAEYVNLIDRIKSSLKGYFSQTYPNYQSIEFEIEQILNEVIIGSFNTYTSKKIDDFSKLVLPDLYTIADSITYDHTIHTTEDNTYDVNLERDNFIRDTMDIDIEEGFENGVVTLKITDDYGKTTVYYSTEAMEKLTGYNQLFESSRPGKKVDTSNWEFDKSRTQPNSMENNITDNNMNSVNNTTPIVDNNLSNMNTDVSNIDTTNNNNTINNENLIKDFLATQTTPVENTIDNFNTDLDFGNLTSSANNNSDVNSNINSNNEFNNLENAVQNNTSDNFKNLDDPSSIMSYFNNPDNDNKTTNDEITFGDLTSPNNNNSSNENELMNAVNENTSLDQEDVGIKQMKDMMESSNDTNSFSGGFSFLQEFEEHNQERNEFIKKTTGMEIDEDVDNNGRLYLKVVEVTGREQIYTGKEAVRMIKNFNKVYLDSNPDKKVDTSLIDDFNE